MAIDPITGQEVPDETTVVPGVDTQESLLGSTGPVDPTPIDPTTAAATTTAVVTPEQTVSGQLSQLLSQDSKLIQQARSGAAERAQRSGLLSSSLAAGAGESAAIESALPIATADARTFAESGLLRQGGEQDVQLAKERGDISSLLQEEGAVQQSEIQREASIQRLELEDTAAANALRLQDAKAEQSLSLETFAQTQQNNRLSQELNQQLEIADTKVLNENKQVFTEATGKMFQQYQDTFTKIQTTPDDILDASEKNRLIDQNQVQLQSQIDVLASLYSIPIEWETTTLEETV